MLSNAIDAWPETLLNFVVKDSIFGQKFKDAVSNQWRKYFVWNRLKRYRSEIRRIWLVALFCESEWLFLFSNSLEFFLNSSIFLLSGAKRFAELDSVWTRYSWFGQLGSCYLLIGWSRYIARNYWRAKSRDPIWKWKFEMFCSSSKNVFEMDSQCSLRKSVESSRLFRISFGKLPRNRSWVANSLIYRRFFFEFSSSGSLDVWVCFEWVCSASEFPLILQMIILIILVFLWVLWLKGQSMYQHTYFPRCCHLKPKLILKYS